MPKEMMFAFGFVSRYLFLLRPISGKRYPAWSFCMFLFLGTADASGETCLVIEGEALGRSGAKAKSKRLRWDDISHDSSKFIIFFAGVFFVSC